MAATTGTGDRATVDQYTDEVREIERRLHELNLGDGPCAVLAPGAHGRVRHGGDAAGD